VSKMLISFYSGIEASPCSDRIVQRFANWNVPPYHRVPLSFLSVWLTLMKRYHVPKIEFYEISNLLAVYL
jgi:hypothetical protein